MLNLLEDVFKESTIAIATAWAFAYESNTRLIDGLRKKSLHAKKGMIVNQRGEGSFLQGGKKKGQIDMNNWKECTKMKWRQPKLTHNPKPS
jgi:hypothetical protein